MQGFGSNGLRGPVNPLFLARFQRTCTIKQSKWVPLGHQDYLSVKKYNSTVIPEAAALSSSKDQGPTFWGVPKAFRSVTKTGPSRRVA